MKRYYHYLLGKGLTALLLFCLLDLGQTMAQNMYVSGRFVYTAKGEKVVLRGVNEMFWPLDNSTIYTIGKSEIIEIAKTGANSVRIGWLENGKPLDALDTLIATSIRNKMIPIVEYHRGTDPDWSWLTPAMDFWKRNDVRTLIKKYEKWVIVNICNEEGDYTAPSTDYKNNYSNAVATLRGLGYNNLFMIDAAYYGQKEESITDNWQAIQNADPNKNVMFSLHPYWDAAHNNLIQRLTDFVNTSVSNNIPVVIGEGIQSVAYNCTPWPYEEGLAVLKNADIGWLFWSWGYTKNTDCTQHDMTNDGTFGNWKNDWARIVCVDGVNSLKNVSVRPSFDDGNITEEIWTGITGTAVSAIPTTNTPSSTSKISKLEIPINSADNYGVRVRGYIVPKATGSYTFYIASDDNGEFWLSSNNLPANKAKICTVSGWTNSQEWTKYTEQKSAVQNLTAGTKYYFEALMKEATGGDNLAIGWTGPNISNITVLSGDVLEAYVAGDTQAPTAPTALSSSSITQTGVTLSWTASTDNVGVTGYDVYNGSTKVNGSNISGTAYTVTGLSSSTTYSFTVKAKDAAGNTSAASSSVSVTTLPTSTGGSSYIYDDILQNGWTISGGSNYNISSTAQVKAGSKSISIQIPGAWEAIDLSHSPALTTSGFTSLNWWVYGGTGGTKYQVIFNKADGSEAGRKVFVAPAGQWTQQSVNLSDVGSPASLSRVTFQDQSGGAQPVFYIDELTFNGTTPPPTTSTVFDDVLQNAWTATGGATYSLSSTGQVKVGTKSISIQIPSAWQALELNHSTAFSLSGYANLAWWAYGGTNGTKYQVIFIKADGSESGRKSFVLTAGQWTRCNVNWSEVGNPTSLTRIIYQDQSGGAQPVFYLDDISFGGSATGRFTTEESLKVADEIGDISVYPNPSTAGHIKVQWLGKASGIAHLALVDMAGKIITQKTHDLDLNGRTVEMSTENTNTGLYVLKIVDVYGQHNKKVVIK